MNIIFFGLSTGNLKDIAPPLSLVHLSILHPWSTSEERKSIYNGVAGIEKQCVLKVWRILAPVSPPGGVQASRGIMHSIGQVAFTKESSSDFSSIRNYPQTYLIPLKVKGLPEEPGPRNRVILLHCKVHVIDNELGCHTRLYDHKQLWQ